MEKIIKGFENYSVSDTGIVRNIKTGKIKVGVSNNAGNGYMYIDLYNKGKRTRKFIHRIVAESFIPNPQDKPMVNHRALNDNTK